MINGATRMKKKFGNREVEQQVIDLLLKTKIPCDVNHVAQNLNMGWGTARSILLDLTIRGSVQSKKTTKGLIFWVSGSLGQIKE